VDGEREQIAFDGEVIRDSGKGSSLNPLQLMSAMVVDIGLILYQQKVSDKTNQSIIPPCYLIPVHLNICSLSDE
jgi:hypothetical protein